MRRFCRTCGVDDDEHLIPVAFKDVAVCRPCWARFLAWIESESGQPLNEPEDLELPA